VGSEQELHFKAVFKTAKKCGLITQDIRLDHCGFGMLLGSDGKKIKSRSGETIKLRELLDEAGQKAKEKLEERAKEDIADVKMVNDEFAASSEILGISSVKYFDLKQSRLTSYKFDYANMLNPNGNTAV